MVHDRCNHFSFWATLLKTRMPELSRLEFPENFLTNNVALSDAEHNTSGTLNRGGIADLPLLKTLLAIRQKSQEPSF